MPSLKCPHCLAITEFTAVSDNQTIVCEHCGKTVRVKDSVRSQSASGSPAAAENAAISDKPQAGSAKPEPAKTPTASKSALPDFAAIATAAATKAPTAVLPDFAGLNIKTRPTPELKKVAPKSPATAAEVKDAVPAKPAEVVIKQPKARVEADKPSDKGLAKEKPQAVEKQAVEKPQAPEKKPNEPVDDMAGFREFAAIVSGAAAPTVPIVTEADSSSRSPSPVVTAVAESAIVEKVPASKPVSATSRDKSAKAGRLFGQAWIPTLVDATAWLLLATAIYVIYALISGAVSVVMGIAIAVALAAAGVMMFALALGVRLLLQMADSSVRSRSE